MVFFWLSHRPAPPWVDKKGAFFIGRWRLTAFVIRKSIYGKDLRLYLLDQFKAGSESGVPGILHQLVQGGEDTRQDCPRGLHS